MTAAQEEIVAWLSGLASDIITDADDTVAVADRLAVASTLDAAAFAAEAIDIARIVGESVRTDTAFKRIAMMPVFDSTAGADGSTVLAAVAQAIGIGRVGWISRPAARAARESLVALAHRAYAVAAPLGPDLYSWLASLVSVAVRLVSERAANATPMVIVESGISLPSTVLAYQLYGDATRAGGLFDMAGAATPMIMPARFEALAS